MLDYWRCIDKCVSAAYARVQLELGATSACKYARLSRLGARSLYPRRLRVGFSKTRDGRIDLGRQRLDLLSRSLVIIAHRMLRRCVRLCTHALERAALCKACACAWPSLPRLSALFATLAPRVPLACAGCA